MISASIWSNKILLFYQLNIIISQINHTYKKYSLKSTILDHYTRASDGASGYSHMSKFRHNCHLIKSSLPNWCDIYYRYY
jgi:hypothetical protein